MNAESDQATVPAHLLEAMFDATSEGAALLDADGRTLLVNEAARRLLGDAPVPTTPGSGTTMVGQAEVDYRSVVLPGGERAVYLRDVTRLRQRERQLVAFGQAAASIAFAHDLKALLDRLAEAVRQTTGMFSCTFLLYDDDGDLEQSGTAGDYPRVPDYARRLRRCRDLGAPLLADAVVQGRAPVIESGWRRRTLADPRFEPLHDISHTDEWDTIVVVPLVFRDRVLGVFNGFYALDHEPGDADLPFLTAIADQAAVAVENARLLERAEEQAALLERHRLARELHDSVNQLLFSLSLHTRALTMGADPVPPPLAAQLAEVASLSANALVEMRALIFQLRPSALHDEGLVSAVRNHATALAAREGVSIDLALPDDLAVGPEVEEQVFRVAQEALHNVVKHVPGASVRLSLRAEGQDLVLEVHDDGTGFDTDAHPPGHFGLLTMAERMEQLGGRLTIASRPDGTSVRAHLPGVLA